MALNEDSEQQYLAPLAVTALRQEESRQRVPVERTASMDIREEREDLRKAAEQSLNVILDLNLDGTIRWVGPSWRNVVGTDYEDVKNTPIADLLLSNKDGFANALESMRKDDSKSRIIRFKVALGPLSVLRHETTKIEDTGEADKANGDTAEEEEQELNLEGQGIMVYDRSTGGESHVRLKSMICDLNVS